MRKSFFQLSTLSVKQLDLITDSSISEDEKDGLILKNLWKLIVSLFNNLTRLILSIAIGIAPIYLYLILFDSTADTSSIYFYSSITLGSFILLTPIFNTTSDYGYWSKLIHTLILDHYSLGRYLFKIDSKKLRNENNDKFIVVTGLARAGTTALTNLLYDENTFHSTSYANMPFLMAPRLWKKIYNPKNSQKKERAHKDSVLFGHDSIEALEEYFFKAKLNDSFIQNETLTRYQINQNVYDDYLKYQQLFCEENKQTLYLTKNNNFILKYESLRQLNRHFKVLLLIREPMEHAQSLMQQHSNFSNSQSEDPFILQYMDWLGHHEFGLNQKVFDFGNLRLNHSDKNSINYWLEIWLNFYSYVSQLKDDTNLTIIKYNDLLNSPSKLKESISDFIEVKLEQNQIKPFVPKHHKHFEHVDLNNELYEQCMQVYDEVASHSIKFILK